MNHAEPSHPSTEQLSAFALGKVDDAELAHIAEHLAECPDCCARLEALNASDVLLERLQKTEPELHPLEDSAERGAGVRHIRQLLRSRQVAAAATDTPSAADAVDLGFLQPAGRPDALGRLGHYDILEVLGQGGFGVVFRAFDDVLQRVVAIKLLDPELAATSPARKRFLREARSAAQVRHDNVVQIHAVEEQPLPYLVMEFIPGETLQQRLDRTGPLEAPEVAQIGRQVAEGLAAAHAVGMIHRDVKPANILIEAGPRLRVKLTDFGLARAADDASLTQSGVVAGTPMFMSPEQARGEKLDQRSDLFSLGSVLYAVTSGRPPFRAESALAVLKRVTEEQPRPIPEIIPETPAWLCDLIARLMAKDPAERFPTAAEAGEALATGLTVPLPVAPPPARRPGLLWAGGVLALIAVLGVVAFFLTRPDGGSQNGVPPPGNKEWPKEVTNALGMKFRFIPAGKFKMGSSQEEIERCRRLTADAGLYLLYKSEGPEQQVAIARPFYLAETEVTYNQFRQYAGDDPARGADNRPVVRVSWHEAVAFCNWLSQKEGKKYRLPTEAEWEYACRAGRNSTRYCCGDDDAQLDNYAWYDKNAGGWSQPVGSKRPNDWGLYDMHGNVWEWCQDVFDPKQSHIVPRPSTERVLRGGSWFQPAFNCRSACRTLMDPQRNSHDAGFRVVLEGNDVADPSKSVDAAGPSLALLPLTDVARDSVGGDWKLEDGVLTAPVSATSTRLKLAYHPLEEYDFSLSVERKAGTDAFLIGLVVGGRQVLAVFDGWGGQISGLNLLDGKAAPLNATRGNGSVLPLGSPVRITCAVRRNRVTVSVAGNKHIDWQGNPEALSLEIAHGVPNPDCLFVGACGASFALRNLEVHPVSAPGWSFSDPAKVGVARCVAEEMLWTGEWQLTLTSALGPPVKAERLAHLPDGSFQIESARARPDADVDRLLRRLPDRTQIRQLDLDHTALTDAAADALSRLHGVEELSVLDTRLGDAGLAKVAGLTGLKQLRIGAAQFSAAALKDFARRLPGCRVTQLSPDQTAVRTWLALGAIVRVKDRHGAEHTIQGIPGFSESEELSLLQLRLPQGRIMPDWHFRCLRNLKEFHVILSWYNGLNDACVQHWQNLPRLEELHLGTSGFTPVGLKHLAGLAAVRVLHLPSTPCNDAGLAQLKNMPRLEVLTLSYTPITAEGLKHLVALPALRGLELNGTGITDAAVEPLSKLNKLKALKLVGTKLTPEGVDRLRKALPGCSISNP